MMDSRAIALDSIGLSSGTEGHVYGTVGQLLGTSYEFTLWEMNQQPTYLVLHNIANYIIHHVFSQ